LHFSPAVRPTRERRIERTPPGATLPQNRLESILALLGTIDEQTPDRQWLLFSDRLIVNGCAFRATLPSMVALLGQPFRQWLLFLEHTIRNDCSWSNHCLKKG